MASVTNEVVKRLTEGATVADRYLCVVLGYPLSSDGPTGCAVAAGPTGYDAETDARLNAILRGMPSRRGWYTIDLGAGGGPRVIHSELRGGRGDSLPPDDLTAWPLFREAAELVIASRTPIDLYDKDKYKYLDADAGDELDSLASEARAAAEAQLRAFGVFATDVGTPPPLPVWRTEPEVVVNEGTAARPFDLSRQFHTMGLTGPDGRDKFPDGQGVLVGVIDTGCDLPNPLIPADRVRRLSTVPGNPDGSDPSNGHGTSCVGYICGDGIISGTTRYRGVSLGCNVLSVAALTQAGWGTDLMISQAVAICVKAGCRVVSMSIGGRDKMPLTEAAIKDGQEKGVIFVCAAGNSGPGRDTVDYPGRLLDVITVGACSDLDESTGRVAVADFSSTGPDVDILAPGVMVPGVHPGGRVIHKSGTSMATPLVAGVLARYVAHLGGDLPPDLSPVKDAILVVAAHGRGSDVAGYDESRHGAGLILAGALIDSAGPDPEPDPEEPPPTTLYLDKDAVEATNRAAIVIADVFAALREHGSVTLRYQPPTQNRKM